MIRGGWVDGSAIGGGLWRAARLTLGGLLVVGVAGCSGPGAASSAAASVTASPPTAPLASTFLASPRTSQAAPLHGEFSATGSMAVARTDPVATLLADGMVLVFGGCNCTTAELFDPGTDEFVRTGSMAVTRTEGAAATLLEDGLVLIAGGDDASGTALASAELYDPATGQFSLTGSMSTARTYHTASLLANGEVLIAGGLDGTDSDLATAELYEPATGRFVPTGVMDEAMVGQTATVLPDNWVLLVGGTGSCVGDKPSPGAELYDPGTGKFSRTGSMASGRTSQSAVLLADGEVLLVGGNASCVQEEPLASAELYDPGTGKFSRTGSMASARDGQSATLLADGRVLVAGGADGPAELYDPTTGTFSPTGSTLVARATQSATLLRDGRVLLAGGAEDPADGSSAETYQP